jgi:hypothetical protein
MANTGTQRRMNAQAEATKKWLAVLCACVMWSTGCFMRRAPAKPMMDYLGYGNPVVPEVATDATLEPPPDIVLEAAAAPPQLVTSHDVPSRPHVTPPPATEPAPEPAPEPRIAPEVTTEEMAAAKVETQHSLDKVEKNLTLAWGRKLDPTQEDLISKVRGFTEGARESMRSGDWVRAKNLAKKAEVLSEQLAASL